MGRIQALGSRRLYTGQSLTSFDFGNLCNLSLNFLICKMEKMSKKMLPFMESILCAKFFMYIVLFRSPKYLCVVGKL